MELSRGRVASRTHGQWTLALGGREITGICLPNHRGEAEGRSTVACDRARRGEASCRSRARGGSRRNDEQGGACRCSASGASLGRSLGRRSCWVRARRRDRAERRSSRRTGCAPRARAPRARNPTRHGRLRLGCVNRICVGDSDHLQRCPMEHAVLRAAWIHGHLSRAAQSGAAGASPRRGAPRS